MPRYDDSGVIFVGGATGVLHALNTGDGNAVEFATAKDFETVNSRGGERRSDPPVGPVFVAA
jgi:hypothetical protein